MDVWGVGVVWEGVLEVWGVGVVWGGGDSGGLRGSWRSVGGS